MTMERRASGAMAPALRMMCASPMGIPREAAGSMRASMPGEGEWRWSGWKGRDRGKGGGQKRGRDGTYRLGLCISWLEGGPGGLV